MIHFTAQISRYFFALTRIHHLGSKVINYVGRATQIAIDQYTAYKFAPEDGEFDFDSCRGTG